MSDEDYDNLEFLLSISREEFDEWWDTVDDNERRHALTILKMAQHEIIERAQEKTGELDLAKKALSRFMM